MPYSVRLAQESDASNIMEIIESAREFLRTQGLSQWQNGYPNLSTIQSDIDKQQSYVLLDDERIVGTFCLCFGAEPTYAKIYDGAWSSSMPYATIHRVAVDQSLRGKGLASLLLQQASVLVSQNGVGFIRVDTHPSNLPMQKLLQKNGFIKCGTIYLSPQKTTDDERVAFEKILV